MKPEKVPAANRTAIFAALKKAGVASVEISYDGSHDDGDIVHLAYLDGNNRNVSPAGTVKQIYASGKNFCHQKIGYAVTELAYDHLREKHDGWKHDIGSYGSFEFDVAARLITLTHNQRIETSETTVETF